ncbi:hypothetical protein PQQ51_23025 [Paraburkholderia xenovorans]|uniref:hypothetical protein n=1 Tax=Paraburkholderia xenovorans TaxID=36873 RepID=UPI0038B6F98C
MKSPINCKAALCRVVSTLRAMLFWRYLGARINIRDIIAIAVYVATVGVTVWEVVHYAPSASDPQTILEIIVINFTVLGLFFAYYSFTNISEVPKDSLKEQKFYTEILASSSVVSTMLTVAGHLLHWFGGLTILLGVVSAFLGAISAVRKITTAYLDWKS